MSEAKNAFEFISGPDRVDCDADRLMPGMVGGDWSVRSGINGENARSSFTSTAARSSFDLLPPPLAGKVIEQMYTSLSKVRSAVSDGYNESPSYWMVPACLHQHGTYYTLPKNMSSHGVFGVFPFCNERHLC